MKAGFSHLASRPLAAPNSTLTYSDYPHAPRSTPRGSRGVTYRVRASRWGMRGQEARCICCASQPLAGFPCSVAAAAAAPPPVNRWGHSTPASKQGVWEVGTAYHVGSRGSGPLADMGD